MLLALLGLLPRVPGNGRRARGARWRTVLAASLLVVLSSCATPVQKDVLASATGSVAPSATLDTTTFAILMLEPTKRQFVILDASGGVVRTHDVGGATTLPSISVSDDGRRVTYWRSASSIFGTPYELVLWDVLTNDAKVVLELTTERPWGRPVLSSAGDLLAYATSTFEPPSPPDAARLRVMTVSDRRERVVVANTRAYPILPLAFNGDELDAMQYAVDGSSQTNMALELSSGRVLRTQTSPICRDVRLNYQSGGLLCATQEREGDPVEFHAWALSTFPAETLREVGRAGSAILWTGKAAVLIGAAGPGSSYELRSQTFPRTTQSVLHTFDVASVPLSVSPDGRWLLLAQTTFPGLAVLDLTAASGGSRALTVPQDWRGTVALGWIRRP